MRTLVSVVLAWMFWVGSTPAADDVAVFLNQEVIGPRLTLLETKQFVEARLARMPTVANSMAWEQEAERIRQTVLKQVVFRGAATDWGRQRGKVEYLDALAGGPGYKMRAVRYEAIPGLWIPAILYEPERIEGKIPVALAVNGHDPNGKAADYKQIRCVNMARRGMIVLNLEWFGMGQLRMPGYSHGRMNQLDLCGTSGLAPFYLAMTRGLDILLDHPQADSRRVSVSGLSGGGWQTILVSALDTRVTLSNPVAGYSSFRTRLEHDKDLGDSEQTPTDLGAIADYTHLTALRAPRPTLLTYNAKDNCCFESGYTLPPLLDASRPIFALYGRENALRTHINQDPGDHNFGKDNRLALYRMLGDHFFPKDTAYPFEEISTEGQIRTKEQLAVELPKGNADFHSLSKKLSESLPRGSARPGTKKEALAWQEAERTKVRGVVKTHSWKAEAERGKTVEKEGVKATSWKVRVGGLWTVPVVEFTKGEVKGTTLLVADGGRTGATEAVRRLLGTGQRVLAMDPFYFGESKLGQKDWLFALLVATVAERPLGIQSSQVAAVARWAAQDGKAITLEAQGPRSSLFALTAAALENEAIARVDLYGSRATLKEVLEENRSVEQMPEVFCFGLLEVTDISHLVAMVAPRPVRFVGAGERHKKEGSFLKSWYALLGSEHDPYP